MFRSMDRRRVAGVFCLAVAVLVAAVCLFLGVRSSKTLTGYDTEIVFVGDNDYSAESKFMRLTGSGWEIKSSRRAWEKRAYSYSYSDRDEQQWGTEYTLQKAIYGAHNPGFTAIPGILSIAGIVSFVVALVLLRSKDNLASEGVTSDGRGLGEGLRLGSKLALWAFVIAVVIGVALYSLGQAMEHNPRHMEALRGWFGAGSRTLTVKPTPSQIAETAAGSAIRPPVGSGSPQTEQAMKLDDSRSPIETRRLAPEGTVYNVVRLSVRVKNGLAGIEPGTKLKVISKSDNGSLHVQTGDLITDVPQSAVTNDFDVATAIVEQVRKAYMPTPTPGGFLYPY